MPLVKPDGGPAPVSLWPRDIHRMAERVVAEFAEQITRCGAAPRELLRVEITAIAEQCLEFVAGVLDGRPVSDRLPRLEEAAGGWARDGVGLEAVLHALHTAFRLVGDFAAADTDTGAREVDSPGSRVDVTVRILDTVTAAIIRGYGREYREATERGHAIETFSSALLDGHATEAMARDCGTVIAERYSVIALHLGPHPAAGAPAAGSDARRALRRVRGHLIARAVPAVLGDRGGTLLLPAADYADRELTALLSELAAVSGEPVTAAMHAVDVAEVPATVAHVRHLLDTVIRLGYPHGLYGFDRMAVQVQLSRPGRARDRLARVLDPLLDRPDLMDLLHVHLNNNLNRQLTARRFGVHPNTVDHRLKRVADLTGWDAAGSDGAWVLRSALIARGYVPDLGAPAAPGSGHSTYSSS